MNPIQIAKAHCDCFDNNSCLGLTINDSLQLIRFRPENLPCLLSDPSKRCPHFEQCILPMEKRQEWHKDSRRSASIAAEFRQGAHEYRIKTGFMADSVRLCPQCRTAKIGKGRKICDACKDKNRRTSKAISDRIRNAESNSHSSSISDVDSQ